MTEEGTRINKYLSEHGICSRREADRLLEQGRIKINREPAENGQKVRPGDVVTIDGRKVGEEQKDPPVVLAFHKPVGIVCSTGTKDRAENIVDYINYKYRIYPIGRLDKDSRGIILLTNRGELVNGINRARNAHEKEYVVTCRDRISDEFLRRMAAGVEIRIPNTGSGNAPDKQKKNYTRVVTRKCRVSRVDEYTFNIVLTQGLNRQIRRMCEALGNQVTDLKRIRIMNIKLGELPEGRYRVLNNDELRVLENMISQND